MTDGDWSEVAPGLWQGGQRGTPSGEHFDAVLTLGYAAPFFDGIDRADQLEWRIADQEQPPPAAGLDTCVEWVRSRRQGGQRVLVRCQLGLNRSGLVVGKVLVAAGWSPDDAIAAIRAARGPRALYNATYRRLIRGELVIPQRFGAVGAAGVLFRDRGQFLLLKRSGVVHHPGTWGLPGGALNVGESPWDAARREVAEELGTSATDLSPVGVHTHRDPGGWCYTTFVVDAAPKARLNAEHTEARWVTADEALELPLHPTLALSWPELVAEHEPERAWRVFNVTTTADGDPVLKSPAQWLLGDVTACTSTVLLAACNKHPVVDEGCECGVYAIGDFDEVGPWWAPSRCCR